MLNPANDINEVVLSSLADVEKEFQENELAYLALTTKIELPFRDKWAFLLHNRPRPKLTVAREWKRTDLAILDRNEPAVLVELTAMYTFDAVLYPDIHGFFKKVQADQRKVKKLCSAKTVEAVEKP